MSRHATAYVSGSEIADETDHQTSLLLAKRTNTPGDPYCPEGSPSSWAACCTAGPRSAVLPGPGRSAPVLDPF